MPANTGSTEMFYGAYSFSPVPVFTETVETFRDQKSDSLFRRTTRDFTGVLLGSPSESGTFSELFNEKESLRLALASGNQEFRIVYEGSHLVSGEFPRIIGGPSFEEGTWTTRINYSFSTEIDEQISDTSGISQFSETWTFDEAEDNRTVNVQHSLNAVGINTNPSGTNNAFENAKGFVLDRTGFSNAKASAPFFAQVSGISFDAYEELRNEQHDIAAGAFQITERFVLASGNFIHVQNGQFNTDTAGITTVTLTGNVRGLGRKGNNLAFQRAKSAFQTTIRPGFPGNASGVYSNFNGDATLFTTNEAGFSITQNPFGGTLDYSVQYTDSPEDDLPSGILEFNINVQEQDAVGAFVSFSIFDRSLGNVIQDTGTSDEGTITVAGNAVGKPGFPFTDLLAFVEDKINANRPDSNNFVTLRPSSKQITKDERANTVSFSVQFTFTKELSQVYKNASEDINIV